MKKILVNKNQAGQRLDKLLFKILNNAPKSFIYKMLRKKNIVLNGKKAEGSEIVRQDDEIKLYLSDETINKFTAPITSVITHCELDIIYEDDNVLILNKPIGVLSQKAKENDISMVEYIISYIISSNQITKDELLSFKPGICNRLDRNTSGILIAGKTLVGLQEMARILREKRLDKYYLCIVKGKLSDVKTITGYLFKDKNSNKVTISSYKTDKSDYIVTQYEPLICGDNYTLLQVKLITGKSHQIRAHLAGIGHPIIGDYKYGDRVVNDYFEKEYGLKAQLLHSYRCVFPQLSGPLSNLSEKIFEATEPKVFRTIRNALFN